MFKGTKTEHVNREINKVMINEMIGLYDQNGVQ